jgi:hypothetical protein|tara:strand:- start:34 stop:699 length:666 start_codon:yes stop_codon:yes gene_type:complete
MAVIGKVASTIAKKVAKSSGAGRKRRSRGVKPATLEQKMGAKQADITVTEFKKLPEPQQKKFIKAAKDAKKPTKKKQPKVKRSSKDNKELRSLMAQQKKEMKEDAFGSDVLPGRRATGPKGQEVQQGPLLSKVPTPTKKEMSSAARRRLGKSGMLKRGEYAPPASMIQDIMGAGRGREMMPTGKELDDLIKDGFQVKAYGGKVKRRMGGKVKGYGKAKRGY